jgi:hypothetical protein
MAIYYTGSLVGNQINFTTGSASIVAADLKQYVIDQTVSGGQTGLTPSTKATFDFTTGVSGYFSGQDYNLRVATGVISNFTGTLGTSAFRDISETVAENGTGVSTSDSVWDFGTGLSGYLSINAGNLYQVNASSPTANTANINLTGRVSGQVFNDFVQVVAGTGLELSVATDAITISHKDTSSVADVTVAAAAGSAITGVVFTFDPFGHVLSATGQTAVIVRDQIASGVTTTAPSEGSVHTLSGMLRTLINESYARDLDSVTSSGNSTTNGITVGDLTANGNVILGSDASDTLTVKAGPVVFLNSVQSSDAVVFGPNDATKVSAYKSDTNLLRLDGSLVITGNLTVSGTTTYINTTETNIGDATITLNADFTGAVPTENAGIEIERGTEANTALRWNEGLDRWQFTNDGTTYYNMPITSEFTMYDLTVAAGGTNDAIIRITGSNGDVNDITVSGSSGILVTDNGSNLIVVSHEDTSSAVNTVSTNTQGVVIQSFTGLVDTYGHITGLGLQTTDLDVLYPRTGQVTLDYITTNGSGTANDLVIGGVTVSGSAQAKSDHFVVYCTTTGDATTEMFLNGTSGRITVANNSAASFKGTITAFDTTNVKAASWSYDCLVANKAGNTALVANAIVTKFASENGAAWEVFVDGDNTTDSLKLQVKGEAAATIKWTASVISAVVA